MTQRALLAALTLLVALPGALGATLDNASLVFQGGTNTYVQSNTDQPTNVAFTVSVPEGLQEPQFTLDLANLTNPPSPSYNGITVDANQHCSYDSETATYDCLLPFQTEQLFIRQSNSSTIQLNVEAPTTEGAKRFTFSEEITVDDERPVSTYVGPEKCQNTEQCFVGQTNHTFKTTFKEGSGPFNKEELFGLVIRNQATGEDQTVIYGGDSCDGATCTKTFSPTCQNGETLQFSLETDGPVSQDDAGNTVTNVTPTTAICDTQSPSISNVAIEGSNDDVPTVGAGATITARVTEETDTTPTLRASLDNTTTEGSCEQTSDGHRCEVTVTPGFDQPREAEITITAVDNAGNTATQTKTAAFRETTSESSSIWRSATATSLTDQVNKDILEANPKAYARVSFEADRSDATLTDASLQSCNVSESGVESVTIDRVDSDTNQAYLSLKLRSPGYNETLEKNYLKTTCSLEATGTTDQLLFTQGEPENVTITVPLRDGTRLTSNLQDEIDSTRSSIQSYNDGVGRLSRGIEVAQRICRVGSILEGLWGSVSLTGEALSKSQLTKPAAEALKGVEDKGREASSGVWRVTNNKFCQFLSCQTDWQKDQVKQLNQLNQKAFDEAGINPSDNSALSSLQGLTGERFEQAYSPYRSSAAAAWSACLPAIKKHYRNYRAIECSYLDCLDQAQEAGFSVERCQAQRSRAQCTFTGKHIWNNLPVTNLLSQQFSQVTRLLNDPVAAGVTLAGSLYCPSASQDSTFYFLCELGSTAEKGQEYLQDVQQIIKAKQYYNQLRESPKGLCEDAMAATSDDQVYYERGTRGDLSPERAASLEGLNTDQTGSSSDGQQGQDETGEDENTQEGQNQQTSRSGAKKLLFDTGQKSKLNPTTQRPSEPSSESSSDGEEGGDDENGGDGEVQAEYTATGQIIGKTSINGIDVVIRPDGTAVKADTGKRMADYQDETFQSAKRRVKRANDRAFASRLNQGVGPPVSVEEAGEIRDNLGEANMQGIRSADAMRTVASRMGAGQTPSDVEVTTEAGETKSGAKYLAENTGLSEEEAKSLSDEELQEKMKQELGPALGNLTAARSNATPIQMATWNAGALGRSVLTSRSLGFTAWDDWSDTGLEFMEDVASVSETFAAPQRKMCGQVAPSVVGETSGDVGISVEDSDANIGALVSGTRSDFTTPSGQTNSSYVIGYKAVTNQPGLSFDIVFKGPSGDRTVTEQLAGSSPITPSGQGSGGAYRVLNRNDVTLSEQYDTVCMRFDSDPSEYFSRTTFNGNELCQRMRQ